METKKKNKRPREVSSVIPPRLTRPSFASARRKSVDPRFTAEAGEYDEVSFHRNYAFIDDLRKQEIKHLHMAQRESRAKGHERLLERVQKNRLRLENQLKSSNATRLRHELNAQLRTENIKRMNHGERPVYYNNQEMRNRYLVKQSTFNKRIKNCSRARAPPFPTITLPETHERKPKLDPNKLS